MPGLVQIQFTHIPDDHAGQFTEFFQQDPFLREQRVHPQLAVDKKLVERTGGRFCVNLFGNDGKLFLGEQALAYQNHMLLPKLLLHPAQIQLCKLRGVGTSEIEDQHKMVNFPKILCFERRVDIDTLAV